MIETGQGKGVRGNQTQEKEGDGVAGADLYGGDVVAINIGFKLHHVGGSSSVHQALIEYMVHPLQLPLPTKDQYVQISDRSLLECQPGICLQNGHTACAFGGE